MKKYIVTACCQSILLVEEDNISKDELGLCYTCEKCNSSCDIDFIENLVIPDYTLVKVHGDWLGIICGNDFEDTEDFSNVNYAIEDINDTEADLYWCLASDLEIIKPNNKKPIDKHIENVI